MVIHLATDHAGYEHKQVVKTWLLHHGYTVDDCGAYQLDDQDDFTDFISIAAAKVAKKPKQHRAIIFGGSGQGEAILANRFKGVRAAVYYGGNTDIIRLSREHNDANVLSVGARFVDVEEVKEAVWEWLHTEASHNPKYQRRNQKIANITSRVSDFFATKIN